MHSFLIRAAVTIVAFAALLLPFTLLRIPAAIFLVGFAPAYALARRTGATPVGVLAVATTVSPILAGLFTLILLQSGVSPATAPWLAVAILATGFVLLGERPQPVSADDRKLIVYTTVIITVTAILVLALPATNSWWRFRSDSWFHAAVMNRIAARGLPVEDPYFAPLRLQYMYFYHVILLTVSSVARSGPFVAMMAVNLIALAGLSFSFVRLTALFSRARVPRLLALILCLFGMNGLFYLFFPLRIVRAYFGETRGAEMLTEFFRFSPAGHDTAMRLLSVEGNQFLMLDKFMIGTALSLTLGLLCLGLVILVLAKEDQMRSWHALTYVIVTVGLIFLHLFMGPVFVAATIGALLITRFVPRLQAAKRTDLRLLGLTMLAAAVALPYVRSVTPPGESGTVSFAIQPHYMLGLFAATLSALVWFPAIVLRRHGDFLFHLASVRLLLVWIALVAVAATVINLPTNNETKFAFILFVPLAALAVRGIELLMQSRGGTVVAVALLLACTVPLNVTYFVHAFADPSTYHASKDEVAMCDWIRSNTPVDAIFLDSHDRVRVPVLAARDQYWGEERYARNWGYAANEVEGRLALREAMYGDFETYMDLKPLVAMQREFYVVCRLNEKGGRHAVARTRQRGWTLAFESPTIKLFKMESE